MRTKLMLTIITLAILAALSPVVLSTGHAAEFVMGNDARRVGQVDTAGVPITGAKDDSLQSLLLDSNAIRQALAAQTAAIVTNRVASTGDANAIRQQLVAIAASTSQANLLKGDPNYKGDPNAPTNALQMLAYQIQIIANQNAMLAFEANGVATIGYRDVNIDANGTVVLMCPAVNTGQVSRLHGLSFTVGADNARVFLCARNYLDPNLHPTSNADPNNVVLGTWYFANSGGGLVLPVNLAKEARAKTDPNRSIVLYSTMPMAGMAKVSVGAP